MNEDVWLAAWPTRLKDFATATNHDATGNMLTLGKDDFDWLIGAVLILSLIPIPAAPWRYLPYLFAGLVLMGTLASGYIRRRTPAPNASEVSRTAIYFYSRRSLA